MWIKIVASHCGIGVRCAVDPVGKIVVEVYVCHGAREDAFSALLNKEVEYILRLGGSVGVGKRGDVVGGRGVGHGKLQRIGLGIRIAFVAYHRSGRHVEGVGLSGFESHIHYKGFLPYRGIGSGAVEGDVHGGVERDEAS